MLLGTCQILWNSNFTIPIKVAFCLVWFWFFPHKVLLELGQCFISGDFHPIVAELSTYNRDHLVHKDQNNSYLICISFLSLYQNTWLWIIHEEKRIDLASRFWGWKPRPAGLLLSLGSETAPGTIAQNIWEADKGSYPEGSRCMGLPLLPDNPLLHAITYSARPALIPWEGPSPHDLISFY